MNTYVARKDKDGVIIGAELMLQEDFDKLGLDGYTVYRERGITYIRLIQSKEK